MSIIDIVKENLEESDSYRHWFESEWNRNGVKQLISHHKKLCYDQRTILSKLEIAQKCLQEVYDSEGLIYVKNVLDKLKE